MDIDLFEKSKYVVATATTAAAIFPFALSGNISGDVVFSPISSKKYSAENIMSNPYYSLITSDSDIYKELNIIHQFASKIIENSENLEPSIVELVNKNFWNLV